MHLSWRVCCARTLRISGGEYFKTICCGLLRNQYVVSACKIPENGILRYTMTLHCGRVSSRFLLS